MYLEKTFSCTKERLIQAIHILLGVGLQKLMFAETAPKPAMGQKSLSFGGTLALKDANGTSLKNEFAGSVYNFWAYEDRCLLSAPIQAAHASGVKTSSTHYYSWE